jgi:hypothetical protein
LFAQQKVTKGRVSKAEINVFLMALGELNISKAEEVGFSKYLILFTKNVKLYAVCYRT